MRKSEIVDEFTSDIQKVWNIVTNNEDYKWRSDLERIEISDKGRTFIEYTKNGFQTKFIITKKIECSRYEFKMENSGFKGSIGVSTGDIRKLARKLGKSQELAEQLWETKYHEAKILSVLLMDEKTIVK
ncbi:MAG: DNA alkylation repair protein [Tepidanaerobacteraceae bacterium]|nr:DNA alkylation repair protein [Tepidanaerobacteraceae bacterium]